MSQIPVSVQLYTVRDDFSANVAGTLRRVAGLGYRNVELAGFGGLDASDLKTMLDDTGLKAPSAHVGIDQLHGPGAARTLADYATLGCRDIVVPFLSGEQRSGGEGYAAVADLMNEIGAQFKAEGFQLSYHNHDFEFKDSAGGKTGWQQLVERTDPDLVKFELDTYWVLFAGIDPVQLIGELGSRISMVHIKDMDPEDRSFAPVGTGLLPLDGIVAAAGGAGGVKYLVVEQDRATKQTPLEAIEISLQNLKKKGYA